MIKSETISYNYIKKLDVFGSYKGMRYRLSNGGENLIVNIWPEPLCFIKTDSAKIQEKEFEMSVEGKEEAVKWLNEQYEAQKTLWQG